MGLRFADHAFVICLKRAPERRATFERSAAAVGLQDWSVFDAIDGRENAHRMPPRSSGGRGLGGQLTLGELGCFLSHVAVVREAVTRNLDTVAVFEDDVVFAREAAESWAKFRATVPAGWRVLHLGIAGQQTRERRRPRWRRIVYDGSATKAAWSWGSYAYVLNRAGMQEYLDHPLIQTMEFPVDGIMRDMQISGGCWRPTWPIVQLSDVPSTLSE